ncbi:unnamed protein product [Rotaria magnacalcarata]
MIKNSTSKNNLTAMIGISSLNYEDDGAIMYIVTVLIWYSIGIVLMLGMQMLTRSEEIEDSSKRRTRFLIRNLNDHNNTKAILEELGNKQNRDRLWDIYLGKTHNRKDHLSRAETVRIRHIQKQLNVLQRNHRLTFDTQCPSDSSEVNRSTASPTSTRMSAVVRRRSSLDQQRLDRWKELANQSKVGEQLPWAVKRLIIRR